MKRRKNMKTSKLLFVTMLCLYGNQVITQAAIVGPYRADDFTLHLWHFDGAPDSTIVIDETVTNATPLMLDLIGVIEPASAAGFGTALQAGNGSYAWVDVGIQPISQFTSSDFGGAFTFETIVRPDVDPLAPPNHMQILCGDREGDLDVRSWQFRINTDGQLEFTLLAGGVQSLTAPLPSSGPNAALQGQWYHVAVTYTGAEGTDGNLKMYWTLLDENRTEANLLAEFNMQADLAGEPLFVIGTSGRNPDGEGFQGLIDEVRISTLDRYPNEMQFVSRTHVGPYEADGQTLHLWHFDEASDSNTVSDYAAYTPMTLTLQGNATLGNQSLEGFTTAMLTSSSSYATAESQPLTDFVGSDGAFTFEAIIRPDVDPLAPLNHMNIICGENTGGLETRSWQFRINTQGRLEFILLAGGVQSLTTPLPSSGPNAAVAGQWYHVAAAYNGVEATDGNLKVYWTLIDKGKTEAALLDEFNMQADLGGDPIFTIGSSGRNPGGEYFRGLIDEVRISSLDRLPDEMLFTSEGSVLAPVFSVQPSDQLVGLGETLKLQALVSGALPMSYQWLFNDVNLPGEVGDTLLIPNVAFENDGEYRVIATNEHGSAISDAATVTVGATFSELFNTGVDDSGTALSGESVDPHYFLVDSNDLNNLGPDTIVWLDANSPFPSFVINSEESRWIGPTVNPGTNALGRYAYQTTFVIDSADPNTAILEGKWSLNTEGVDILLNGQPTGNANTNFQAYRGFNPFTITEGFVPGLNTLEFVVSLIEDTTGWDMYLTGLRVEMRGVGEALPAGTPTIITQPESKTVRAGGKTTLSVVALGRPPLSYQWLFNGDPINDPNAAKRTLSLNPVGNSSAGSYSVIVTNDSGSVTSEIVELTVVQENQPPVADPYKVTTIKDQQIVISVSNLLWNASDPDGDWVSLYTVDETSTNGGIIVDPGGAWFSYMPPAGFIGLDRFTYLIKDQFEAELIGEIEVEVTEAVE
jgi:hypothetical protein